VVFTVVKQNWANTKYMDDGENRMSNVIVGWRGKETEGQRGRRRGERSPPMPVTTALI
jgi:hypothetical protein